MGWFQGFQGQQAMAMVIKWKRRSSAPGLAQLLPVPLRVVVV